jgi:hypothetical protein
MYYHLKVAIFDENLVMMHPYKLTQPSNKEILGGWLILGQGGSPLPLKDFPSQIFRPFYGLVITCSFTFESLIYTLQIIKASSSLKNKMTYLRDLNST